MLHVGDSIEDDIRGAINVGIKGVWLNRKGNPSPTYLEIDYQIGSLTDLLDIIDN